MPAPLPPADPDVKLPPSVAAAAARSEAIHKQAYQTQDPPADPPADPSHEPVLSPAPPAGSPPVPPPPAPPPAPDPVQPPAPPAPQPGDDVDDGVPAKEWRHRFLSMKGRYEQSVQSIGAMQEQMQELGDELMRTQALMRRGGQPGQPQQGQPQQGQPLLTDEEIKTYGPDLVDVIKRAAREAVAPDLQNAQSQVQQVNQRFTRQAQGTVHQLLAEAVPDWRAINVSPRFKEWCGLRDVYSGAVRGRMLNAAFQAADAPRVIAFFKGFLDEEQATGQLTDPQQQPVPAAPPRQAAVPLGSLTAPGRAKPATGDTTVPADKPIFTRAQIAAFYTNVRKGAYAGRDTEKAQDEAAIFAAQREGRVRG